ncbi:unnamed protein product [Calicophoron daubneyi]|uniref:Uncharacterized protein n=1 Tax=Calicophoron daubneyi TaxID=300641 RepID=A0AAV2TBG0_CALDB
MEDSLLELPDCSEDLPISCTFADQSKKLASVDKDIHTTISAVRKRVKEDRKSRHLNKLAKTSQKETSISDIPPTLLSREDNKSTADLNAPDEEEFRFSAHFNVARHINFTYESEDEHSVESVKKGTGKNACIDSDEGYNGSDEQDRLRKGKLPNVPNTGNSDVQTKTDQWSQKGRSRRKSSHSFRVQLLNELQVDKMAKAEAEDFFNKKLFSVPSQKHYEVRRVDSNLLISLNRKRSARKMR